ncbi:SsrA-binding protein [Candidatus Kaiserbacteria bacterium]|nr:MAG: SsrA-binding protein [Candidatus Kaiserbacteria bacterium]PCI89929.1 MAG: SsrA-binding protein [Candidatus Kaiserbacteria bacterium]
MALIDNKRVRFDFELLKEFEAGIELLGSEVKSIRNKRASLAGARVLVRGGEAFLVGATIQPYQVENTPDSYDPERVRRLLLSKRELLELAGTDEKAGLTLVPISLYNKGRKLKLSFALARGKKKTDKRQLIKERESRIKIERSMKTS